MYRGKVVDTLNGKRSKGLCDFLFYILFIYAVGGSQFDQGDSGFLTDAGHLFVPFPPLRQPVGLVIDLYYKERPI